MMLDDLVRGLFDYAGMFPPAALEFEEALQQSAVLPHVLHRPHLVGADLVLALDALEHLTETALDGAGFDRPLDLCVVGFGPDRRDALQQALDALPAQVRVCALEPAAEDPFVHDWRPLIEEARVRGAQLYIEPRWGDDGWQAHGARFWSWLQDMPGAGAKFRCAGPTALDTTLADVLRGAAAARRPLKATQGLHHPHPGIDRHGFLNVVTGLRMAQCGLPREDLKILLQDDDAASFLFDALGWRGHRLLAQRVAEAVDAVPFSIGSCSLTEPDDELAELHG